jgi:hypothetical protein
VEFLSKPVAEDISINAIESRALRSLYAKLTLRERDVMTWVVRGLLNNQVGRSIWLGNSCTRSFPLELSYIRYGAEQFCFKSDAQNLMGDLEGAFSDFCNRQK